MNSPGRPQGEYRSAQRDGTRVRLPDLLRRGLWAPCAGLAVLAFMLLPRPVQVQASSVRVMPPSTQEQYLERQVERFALNALLVPLLDDAVDPPRWGDPTLDMDCGEASRVEVDGHRLDPGAPMPDGPFSVQWQLADCLPFGVDSLALSGRAELDVSRQGTGLVATVRLSGLRVQHNGVTVVMNKTFTALTP